MKLNSRFKYVIFKINDSFSIVPEEPKSIDSKPHEIPTHIQQEIECWEELVKQLPKDECRYFVYDLVCHVKDGLIRNPIFIVWIPDSAPFREKSLYIANEEVAMKQFAATVWHEATAITQLDFDVFRKFIKLQ